MSKGIIHERIQNDLERLFDKKDNDRSKAYGQEVRLKGGGIADFAVVDMANNSSVFEVKTSKYDLRYGCGKNWYANYNWLVVPYDMLKAAQEYIVEHSEYKNLGLILWSEYGFLIVQEAYYNSFEEEPPKPKQKSIYTPEWTAYQNYHLHCHWFYHCPYLYYFDQLMRY